MTPHLPVSLRIHDAILFKVVELVDLFGGSVCLVLSAGELHTARNLLCNSWLVEVEAILIEVP